MSPAGGVHELLWRLLKEPGIERLSTAAGKRGHVERTAQQSDLVRAGFPSTGWHSRRGTETVHLTIVMELKSRISYIKTIRPGTLSVTEAFFLGSAGPRASPPSRWGTGTISRSLSSRACFHTRTAGADPGGSAWTSSWWMPWTDIPEAEGRGRGDAAGSGPTAGDQISVEELGPAWGRILICDS